MIDYRGRLLASLRDAAREVESTFGLRPGESDAEIASPEPTGGYGISGLRMLRVSPAGAWRRTPFTARYLQTQVLAQ